jgi:membrane dipeptidase
MKNNLKSHLNSIVVDGHNDTMLKIIDDKTWLPKINIGKNTDNHIDIPKLVEGGLNIPFFAAFTSGYYNDIQKSISRTLALINALYWTENNNIDSFKIANSVEDIKEIVAEGKIAAIPTIEGAYSLDENNAIELLRQYYDLGIKVVGFNWNYSNDLGEGCSKTYNDPDKTPSSGGLTKLGEKVALEMNKLGMIIDVSHMAESTFWDIINVSKMPIIASHSGVYALRNHPRNLKDKQLKALAKNGGVIGIVLASSFLTDGEFAYVKDYVDHIDYAVNLIGIDHVGIGSDFDGTYLPDDIENSSELYKIVEELNNRGYKDDDIEKILGKNMLRVLKNAQCAAEYQAEKNKLNLCITPDFKMGEIIEDSTPLLVAHLKNIDKLEIEDLDFKIIVDGISYKGIYDKKSFTMGLKLKQKLTEKFHVITFQVSDNRGKTKRSTIIIYINN